MWHERPRTEPKWFFATDDEPPRPKLRPRLIFLGIWLVGSALLLPMLPLAGSALVCLLSLSLATGLARRRKVRPNREQRAFVIENGCVAFVPGRPGSAQQPLLRLDRPFGLTLLCNSSQSRIVLAVTSAERTLYLGSTLALLEEGSLAALSSRACTVPDDDPVLAAMGPDDRPFDLPFRELVEFRRALAERDGRATHRCVLSGAKGQEVVLEADELRIGPQRLDLQAPLEWRSLWFQEAIAHHTLGASDSDAHSITDGASAIYQATWVRQGSVEAVLVAIAPFPSAAFFRSGFLSGDVEALPPARARDLRLLRSLPEPPPPRELRVGIERTYMLPLRIALERAPRARRLEGSAPPPRA